MFQPLWVVEERLCGGVSCSEALAGGENNLAVARAGRDFAARKKGYLAKFRF